SDLILGLPWPCMGIAQLQINKARAIRQAMMPVIRMPLPTCWNTGTMTSATASRKDSLYGVLQRVEAKALLIGPPISDEVRISPAKRNRDPGANSDALNHFSRPRRSRSEERRV